MRFKFRLQEVLDYRKRLEKIAQKDYAEAQSHVNQCLKQIDEMYDRIGQVQKSSIEAQQSQRAKALLKNGSQGSHMAFNHDFIVGQRKKIENKRVEARELMRIAEEKHDLLISAAREVKVLEKLKDKDFEIFKREKAKHEASQLDELSIQFEGRRAKS